MKKILDFFLYSNIFVALCASAFCLFTFELFYFENDKWLITLFVFFSTVLAYNFQRFNKNIRHSGSIINKRDAWLQRHKKVAIVISFISLLAAILFFILLPNFLIILLIPLSVICIWYALGIVKKRKYNKPLREIPLLKIFLISFVWIGACFVLPIVNAFGYAILINFNIQLIALALASFIFSLTLPFDIRDLKNDEQLKLLTFPTRIGIYKTKLLSYCGFILSNLIFFYLYNIGTINFLPFLAFVASSLLAIVLVSYTSIKRGELFYSLLLESSLLFPFAFSQLLKLIN